MWNQSRTVWMSHQEMFPERNDNNGWDTLQWVNVLFHYSCYYLHLLFHAMGNVKTNVNRYLFMITSKHFLLLKQVWEQQQLNKYPSTNCHLITVPHTEVSQDYTMNYLIIEKQYVALFKLSQCCTLNVKQTASSLTYSCILRPFIAGIVC